MNRKFIKTAREKKRSPLIAGLLSLVVSGLGQFYNGEAGKGIILVLLRVMPLLLIPVHNFFGKGLSHVVYVAVMIGISLLVMIISIADAIFTAHLKINFSLKRYNTLTAYILFGLAAKIIVSSMLVIILGGLDVAVVPGGQMLPTIGENEVILINKLSTSPRKGRIVWYRTPDGYSVARLIGKAGDRVGFSGHSFFINGKVLPFGVFSSSETVGLGLPNREDLYYEINGGVRYPLLANAGKKGSKPNAGTVRPVGKGKLLVANDNRILKEGAHLIDESAVAGEVTGIVWSPEWRRLLLGVYFPEK